MLSLGSCNIRESSVAHESAEVLRVSCAAAPDQASLAGGARSQGGGRDSQRGLPGKPGGGHRDRVPSTGLWAPLSLSSLSSSLLSAGRAQDAPLPRRRTSQRAPISPHAAPASTCPSAVCCNMHSHSLEYRFHLLDADANQVGARAISHALTVRVHSSSA